MNNVATNCIGVKYLQSARITIYVSLARSRGCLHREDEREFGSESDSP